MWFHIPDYDKPDPYNNLIERFISYYKERIYNNCVLCSIGKKVIFEYETDCYRTICNSHNIDVWIMLSDEYESVLRQGGSVFMQYSIKIQDDFVVLHKMR